MNFSNDFVGSLTTERQKLETQVDKNKTIISAIDDEKSRKIVELKTKHNREIAELEALYEQMVTKNKSELRELSADISKINRAISALSNQQVTQNKSAAPNSPKITSDMIQESIIMHLYTNSDGETLSGIGDMLEQRGYLDPNKNRMATLSGIVGNMVRAGMVDRKNNLYVLADEQEAIHRVKLRKFIMNILREKESTVEEIEKKVLLGGLLNKNTDKRRIRGIVIGLSNAGKYVTREMRNNKEYFRAIV